MEKQLRCPLILLSISRAYRHIRAKLIHEGYRYRVSLEEAEGILNNTRALITELFTKPRLVLDGIKSINNLTDEEISDVLELLPSDQLMKIMKEIFDEISILSDWSDIAKNEKLYAFIRSAIRERSEERIILFDMFFNSFFPTTSYIQSKLLSILSELVNSISIRNWILEKGYVNKIILEFVNGRSFNDAGITTGMMLSFLPHFTLEQLNIILDAAMSNDQILYSYRAKPNLNLIIDNCKGKADDKKIEQIIKKLKESED